MTLFITKGMAYWRYIHISQAKESPLIREFKLIIAYHNDILKCRKVGYHISCLKMKWDPSHHDPIIYIQDKVSCCRRFNNAIGTYILYI